MFTATWACVVKRQPLHNTLIELEAEHQLRRRTTIDGFVDAGMKVCCGGIVGMGESHTDRASLLLNLANLPEHPESVPINQLVRVPGTPLDEAKDVDPFDFIRMIAVARLMMPRSHVRLSAGRQSMTDEMQALCFLAGANSIFYGEKLLTTGNPDVERDRLLFERLGIKPEQRAEGHVHGDHHEHGGLGDAEHAGHDHGCAGAGGGCGHGGDHAIAGR